MYPRQGFCPHASHPELFIQGGISTEVRTYHAQAGVNQALGALFTDQGAIGRNGDIDPKISQVADVRFKAFVQEGLTIAMQGDNAHVETRPEVGDDTLEILERHNPSPIDEVVLLIALWTVDAAKVAGVDGFDGEEDRLPPDAVALEKIADPRGDPIQVPEVVHAVWLLAARLYYPH